MYIYLKKRFVLQKNLLEHSLINFSCCVSLALFKDHNVFHIYITNIFFLVDLQCLLCDFIGL